MTIPITFDPSDFMPKNDSRFRPLVEEEEKVRISNDRLWELETQGHNIDDWLRDNVGYDGYTEWGAIVNKPYRSFSFVNEAHRTLFILKWL